MADLDTSEIDDEKFYEVHLLHTIELAPNDFARPGEHVRLRGDIVKLHADKIEQATETHEG